MMMNTIKTDIEYLAEGFTMEELPLIRELDELHNKYTAEGRWESMGGEGIDDDDRYWELQKILGV